MTTTAVACLCLEVYYRYLPMYNHMHTDKAVRPGDTTPEKKGKKK